MKNKSIRKARLKKIANQKKDNSGYFSYYSTDTSDIENTRQNKLRELNSHPQEDLYDLKFSQEKPEGEVNLSSQPLSTRYVPGTTRQKKRVENGVYQDPITNKVFDEREPFEFQGESYPGGSPSLQSNIMYLTAGLKEVGHKKYAKRILRLLHDLTLVD